VAQFAPRVALVGGVAGEAERSALRRALSRRFARVEEAAGAGATPPLLVAHEARPRSWHSESPSG
jgi:hypothetical protein